MVKNIRHYVAGMINKVGTCSVCGPNTKTNIRGHCMNKINETNKLRYDEGRSVVKMRDGFTYTSEDKIFLWESQDGKCAICKDAIETPNIGCVDHDHSTIKMRGMLCGSCNKMLGYARDNIESLKSAIVYLENHAEESSQEKK